MIPSWAAMPFRSWIAFLGMLMACRSQPAAVSAANAPVAGGLSVAATRLPPGPQEVLVGTDVVELETFAQLRAAVKVPGKFRGEQGGASATVQIERGKHGITLTRLFQEPGAKSVRAVYPGLAASQDGTRLSAPNLEVLGVKDGILVLESKSGVDGIPASLWISYQARTTR
jgi:hypothetical protein